MLTKHFVLGVAGTYWRFFGKDKDVTPLYKVGLYWLILLAATGLLYAGSAVFVGPVAACGAFGFLGLGGFLPLVYRKRPGVVVLDERDRQIAYDALIAGYSIFWLAFTLGVMGLWAVFYWKGAETISVQVLPSLVGTGAIVFYTARAIAILVQYFRQAGKEE
jgi:hypothetical protein